MVFVCREDFRPIVSILAFLGVKNSNITLLSYLAEPLSGIAIDECAGSSLIILRAPEYALDATGLNSIVTSAV